MRLRRAIGVFIGLVLMQALALGGESTWYVDGRATGPALGTEAAPYHRIQEAIDAPATRNGDTIRVAPGVYTENIDYRGKKVVLVSRGGPKVTHLVSAELGKPTVRATALWGAALHGFTVRDNIGVGIFVSSRKGLRIERCIIRNNEWGIYTKSHTWVVNCNLVGNGTALQHQYEPPSDGAVTRVRDCIFWGNQSDFSGWGHETLFVNTTHLDDPQFFGEDDHHLRPGSPCIDAGSPEYADPDGTRRDIGVFPFDPNYPLGESYCATVFNSLGRRARIHVEGSASISANDLTLSVTDVPAGTQGLFIFGTEQASYLFGDGISCLSGHVARILPPGTTSRAGAAQHALDLSNLPPHVPVLHPGEGRGFQFWYRDPLGGFSGFNFSNAVWVTFSP